MRNDFGTDLPPGCMDWEIDGDTWGERLLRREEREIEKLERERDEGC